MNSIKIEIWERAFNLAVNYDCFDNEELLENQTTAVELFDNANIDISLDKVKEYCSKMSNGNVKKDEITNIFKFVIPTSIFVPRNKDKRIIAMMCDFKFDIEHGIAIIFENEKFKKIVAQDELL